MEKRVVEEGGEKRVVEVGGEDGRRGGDGTERVAAVRQGNGEEGREWGPECQGRRVSAQCEGRASRPALRAARRLAVVSLCSPHPIPIAPHLRPATMQSTGQLHGVANQGCAPISVWPPMVPRQHRPGSGPLEAAPLFTTHKAARPVSPHRAPPAPTRSHSLPKKKTANNCVGGACYNKLGHNFSLAARPVEAVSLPHSTCRCTRTLASEAARKRCCRCGPCRAMPLADSPHEAAATPDHRPELDLPKTMLLAESPLETAAKDLPKRGERAWTTRAGHRILVVWVMGW